MTPPKRAAQKHHKAHRPTAREDDVKTAHLVFDNNALAVSLYGSHNSHLTRIEKALGVTIHARGNELSVIGEIHAVDTAVVALRGLYARLERNLGVDVAEVDAVMRMADTINGDIRDADVEIKTRKRHISPRSTKQTDYIRAIDDCALVFGLGPAGTGKTYLAVAKAVERLVAGDVDRIILSRPAVEAGEQLGFLPGDMREKVDPYLRPLYDALYDMLPGEQVAKRLESGEIEVAPLAFMRGRTLANAFVILDEAQNTTAVQMKMFLTRLGEGSRMVVSGDLTQVDLPRGTRSGLRDAVDVLDGTEGVGFIHFSKADVVRSPLVTCIVEAYDRAEEQRQASAPYENLDDNAGPRRRR